MTEEVDYDGEDAIAAETKRIVQGGLMAGKAWVVKEDQLKAKYQMAEFEKLGSKQILAATEFFRAFELGIDYQNKKRDFELVKSQVEKTEH